MRSLLSLALLFGFLLSVFGARNGNKKGNRKKIEVFTNNNRIAEVEKLGDTVVDCTFFDARSNVELKGRAKRLAPKEITKRQFKKLTKTCLEVQVEPENKKKRHQNMEYGKKNRVRAKSKKKDYRTRRHRRDVSTFVSPEILSFIWPGTKWCGAGDIADDYDDLGLLSDVDKCCRQHDHCDRTILAWSTAGPEFGYLENWNLISTKSHCDCDSLFRECLKEVGTEDASDLGWVFFDFLDMECFWNHNPFECQTYTFWGQCDTKGFSCEKDPLWYFFDQPDFDEAADYECSSN